jgi:hypothetical protein
MIDLREAFDRLTRTNFRLNQETLDTLLAEHLAKQQGS